MPIARHKIFVKEAVAKEGAGHVPATQASVIQATDGRSTGCQASEQAEGHGEHAVGEGEVVRERAADGANI